MPKLPFVRVGRSVANLAMVAAVKPSLEDGSLFVKVLYADGECCRIEGDAAVIFADDFLTATDCDLLEIVGLRPVVLATTIGPLPLWVEPKEGPYGPAELAKDIADGNAIIAHERIADRPETVRAYEPPVSAISPPAKVCSVCGDRLGSIYRQLVGTSVLLCLNCARAKDAEGRQPEAKIDVDMESSTFPDDDDPISFADELREATNMNDGITRESVRAEMTRDIYGHPVGIGGERA